MRRTVGLILAVMMCAAAVGCGSGGSAGKTGTQPVGVNDVLEQGMAAADSISTEYSEPPAESAAAATTEPVAAPSTPPEIDYENVDYSTVDVDLTALSGTMVYSEVYSMVTAPEQYVGKTVKMQGSFAFFHDEATDNYYFACIIQDATACCAQGIEFVLAGEHSYPDDYPEVDEEICVVGVFDTYQEGTYTYCTLHNAKFI